MTFEHVDGAHPVACVDCHDPKTMQLRVTRPGFLRGIRALAESDEPMPHLPSIERWRKADRARPYDPNADATRQEMRSFVCGQCHVEYYCGPKTTLFFPWDNGLKVEQIEAHLRRATSSPTATASTTGSTPRPAPRCSRRSTRSSRCGARASTRARGVACADCHMPYKREGAMKVSDHWVRSPLLNINRACQTCHPYPEAEIQARVDAIQDRTHALMQRAAGGADRHARRDRGGARRRARPPTQLAPALALQRKAQWRLDFVAAENSMGFHAPAGGRAHPRRVDRLRAPGAARRADDRSGNADNPLTWGDSLLQAERRDHLLAVAHAELALTGEADDPLVARGPVVVRRQRPPGTGIPGPTG